MKHSDPVAETALEPFHHHRRERNLWHEQNRLFAFIDDLTDRFEIDFCLPTAGDPMQEQRLPGFRVTDGMNGRRLTLVQLDRLNDLFDCGIRVAIQFDLGHFDGTERLHFLQLGAR